MKNLNGFDYCYKNITVLTSLVFKLKKTVTNTDLPKKFTIILYPNSVFLMPLSTNRLYTHEIVPSQLDKTKIPTRLGYVIRCSNTEAIFKDNKTFIIDNQNMIELTKADQYNENKLRTFYFQENTTDDYINYDKFYFSFNLGDYLKPNI